MRALYTCGFAFSRKHDIVLLVHKNRPKWQVGLWNGIGGRVEKNESPRACMPREFFEETGHWTHMFEWNHFAREVGRDYEVYFYRHFFDGELPMINSKNDVGEPLVFVSVVHLTSFPKVGNLNWLIPMALDPRKLSVEVISVDDDISAVRTW